MCSSDLEVDIAPTLPKYPFLHCLPLNIGGWFVTKGVADQQVVLRAPTLTSSPSNFVFDNAMDTYLAIDTQWPVSNSRLLLDLSVYLYNSTGMLDSSSWEVLLCFYQQFGVHPRLAGLVRGWDSTPPSMGTWTSASTMARWDNVLYSRYKDRTLFDDDLSHLKKPVKIGRAHV